MKLIVITTPYFFEGEGEILTALFQVGMEKLHIRKPQSRKEELRSLLDAVPAEYHSRIVIHDHFELAAEYALAGIHLNSRNQNIPEGFQKTDNWIMYFSAQSLKAYPRKDMEAASLYRPCRQLHPVG